MDHDDVGVIGIEPHPENCAGVMNGIPEKLWSLCLLNGYSRNGMFKKKFSNERFFLIEGAAGGQNGFSMARFFEAYPDKGNSGLYEIQSLENTGNVVKRTLEVVQFPLSEIFSRIDFDRFRYIECLKVDTEGHELEVLKGANDYLESIVFITVEAFRDRYSINKIEAMLSFSSNIKKLLTGELSADFSSQVIDTGVGIKKFLSERDFLLVNAKPGEWTFLNRRFSSEVHLAQLCFD
jgi:FkbM family methyltransferase